MPGFFLAVFLLISYPASAGMDPLATRAELEDLIRLGQSQAALPKSIDAVSAKFLGTPYVLGNAGEGNYDEFDQDPLWRLDAEDCTTYVETVVAISLSRDRREFLRNLVRIRYQNDQISFVTRNHFPEADWIPHNVQVGTVRDLTATLFPTFVRSVSVVVDKNVWYGKMTADSIEPKSRDLKERLHLAELLRSKAGQFTPQAATVAYLPLEAFYLKGSDGRLYPHRDVLRKIPNGAIFNIVREGWAPAGVQMAISHQGFVIQKADGTYMRHASPNRGVGEDRIDQYFLKYLESPTVRGISILGVRNPVNFTP
ncbi:MAG TPA: N-acetylmuramoyl-L-alanine amidase-like domain-containing protein [Bdellovibrionota bacterium]|jgi:hypothetical protein